MLLKPFLPATLWLVAITYLSVSSNVQLPKIELFSADKLAHAGAYAILGWLLAWGVWRSKGGIKSRELFLIFCIASLYGAMMEWVQGTFFPNRFFEYDDMLANAAGAFIAGISALPLLKIIYPGINK